MTAVLNFQIMQHWTALHRAIFVETFDSQGIQIIYSQRFFNKFFRQKWWPFWMLKFFAKFENTKMVLSFKPCQIEWFHLNFQSKGYLSNLLSKIFKSPQWFSPRSGGHIVTRMITIMAVLCHWIPVKEPWRRW